MGVQLEFYAGQADVIGRAFADAEFDGLRDGSLAHAYADFSLHTGVEHLDTLSSEVGLLTGRESVQFLDSLGRNVGGETGSSSADVVSSAWVIAMARVAPESAAELARRWITAVAVETGEDLATDSPDAVQAVGALIALCRAALARGSDVVFVWYL